MPSLCKVRRLSLQRSKVDTEEHREQDSKKDVQGTVDMSHVRSLAAFGDASDSMPSLSRFSVLRILCLDLFPRNNHSKVLGTLHHLRYLKLGGPLETELLEQIGNLQLLKTLNLREASIKELPANIVQLRQLENLLICRRVGLPDGIGSLRCLQKLLWVDLSYASPNTLVELGNLTELRDVSIRGLGHDESDMQTFLCSLSNICNIRTLDLKGYGLYSLDCISDGWRVPAHLQNFDGHRLEFPQLPRWFFCLSKLTYLSIRVHCLTQYDLQLLGALPVLRILKLRAYNDETTEERWSIGIDQPFRSLVKFKFDQTG